MSSENNKTIDNNIAIRLAGISKCYRMYEKPHHRLLQSLFRSRQFYKEFWALKDISLEIRKGQVVGIIGRNGSGKSTLLQIVCGTLVPTLGTIEVNGRVAALLELGAGFNPEFTGKENVYMNASILGLTREAIDSKYDDIVSFADIGDFINQPVKIYSSGMYIRLAFAVIIHVDADILIIDEALSVGDAFFQSKCLVKLHELIGKGLTLFFVSHDTTAVKSLCDSSALLGNGVMLEYGETAKVLEKYFYMNRSEVSEKKVIQNFKADSLVIHDELFDRKASFQRISTGTARFLNVQLLDTSGQPLYQASYEQHAVLRMIFLAEQDIEELSFGYHIRDYLGKDIIYSDSVIENRLLKNLKKGTICVIDWTFRISLVQGDYTISAMLSIPVDLSISKVNILDFVPIAAQFKMLPRENSFLYGAVHWHNDISISFTSVMNLDKT